MKSENEKLIEYINEKNYTDLLDNEAAKLQPGA